MKAEVNAKQSNTQTNIDIKIYNNSHSNIQEKQIVQIHRQGKDAHSTTSAHMFSSFLFPGLALCSLTTSTSIKKEINGPGASEWTHSQ